MSTEDFLGGSSESRPGPAHFTVAEGGATHLRLRRHGCRVVEELDAAAGGVDRGRVRLLAELRTDQSSIFSSGIRSGLD